MSLKIWTDSEQKILVNEVLKMGKNRINWIEIASKVGTKTPNQCNSKWHNRARKNREIVEWTPNEIELLLKAANENSSSSRIPWSKMQDFVETKTAAECKSKYWSLMKVNKRKQAKTNESSSRSKWTEHQILQLETYMRVFNNGDGRRICWDDVSNSVTNKTPEQCEKKWYNMLSKPRRTRNVVYYIQKLKDAKIKLEKAVRLGVCLSSIRSRIFYLQKRCLTQ